MLGLGDGFVSNEASVIEIEDDGLMDFADLEAFTDPTWSAPFSM